MYAFIFLKIANISFSVYMVRRYEYEYKLCLSNTIYCPKNYIILNIFECLSADKEQISIGKCIYIISN